MKKISIIIPLIGDYSELIDNLESAVVKLKQIQNCVDIIFVSYNSSWRFSPQYQLLKISLEECKVIELEQKVGSLGLMLNKSLEIIETELITCIPLNQVECINDIEIISEYIKKNPLKNEIGYITRMESDFPYPSNQVNYGHLQIRKIYNLSDLVIPTNILKTFKFNEDNMLQYDLDWDITLRLAREYDFTSIMISSYKSKKMIDYPFERHTLISNDIIHRYIIALGSQYRLSQYEVKKLFFEDIKKSSYKITVLGGYWEYHHNQICFFNYFEKLFGQGFCSYKVGFDNEVDEYFLKESDLVIFTRCRSENSLKLIEYCKKNKVPTIYMIDDNWISIGRDYPDVYGNLFVTGNPNYDNFIKAISLCDETWCYNEILEEDVKNYAKKTFKFKLNVDTDMYKPLKPKCNDEIVIGYAGSLRSNNEAFEAMVKIAKKYKNVKLVVIGMISNEQGKLFEEIDCDIIEFMPYIRYSKMISNISPDILLAPLEDNRTSNSKCFNKYIESAVIKSIGIYSKVKPYTDIVEDGKNGFFVRDNSVDSWIEKLEIAINDIENLRRMQKNAYEHVEYNYSTRVLLHEFLEEIERVVKNKND